MLILLLVNCVNGLILNVLLNRFVIIYIYSRPYIYMYSPRDVQNERLT